MAAYSINTANVRMSSKGQYFMGTAGGDILAGRPVYLNTTLGTYLLANAMLPNAPAGIAACSANTNQTFVICTRDPNFYPGYTINIGNVPIVGNVPGQVNDISDRAIGWYVSILGVADGDFGNVGLPVPNYVNFVPVRTSSLPVL